jgi:hypothetical protein
VVISASRAVKMTLLTGLSTEIGESKIGRKLDQFEMISKKSKPRVGARLRARNEVHGARLKPGRHCGSDRQSKFV